MRNNPAVVTGFSAGQHAKEMAQLLLRFLGAGQLLSVDNVRFLSELHFDRCAFDGFVTFVERAEVEVSFYGDLLAGHVLGHSP
jgi:hypothetical protein